VYVGYDGSDRRVWSERVYFGEHIFTGEKADLNYKRVADTFEFLFSGVQDYRVAQDILLRMVGRETQQSFNVRQGMFLSDMVALMFGVEASRFPSSLVTSLLLLDLICYGKGYGRAGEKKFTFSKAFHSKHWDDKNWYGGKYPYAVHGTGSGNMAMRKKLSNPDNKPQDTEQILHLTQRHAVPRREVTLLIHWLEASLSDTEIAQLNADKVKSKLTERLKLTFYNQELLPPFPFSPRPDTGTHPYELGWKPSNMNKVFWFTGGKFYHTDPACKGLPGRYQNPTIYTREFKPAPWVESTLKQNPKHAHALRHQNRYEAAISKVKADGSGTEGTVHQAKMAGKQKCPICGRHLN
jgi:hypothetical protein